MEKCHHDGGTVAIRITRPINDVRDGGWRWDPPPCVDYFVVFDRQHSCRSDLPIIVIIVIIEEEEEGGGEKSINSSLST